MAKISKTKKLPPSKYDRWLLFLAFAVCAIYLFKLRIPFLGPDEPRYAQVAREMFERGDWITTTLGGFNWFEKPALLYWLQISTYNIFGVSEFSARLGPALFGLGTVLSLFVLGRRMDSDAADEDRTRLSFWLLAVSATSLGLMVFSRGASFDIIVTFPLTASLVCFYLWLGSAKKGDTVARRTFLLSGFYIFIGVAVLAKGLIGIVFPFGIVGLYYLLKFRLPDRGFLLSLFWGLPVAALVAASWYVPMYQRHGWEFVDEFIIQHHFQRFTSNKYLHPQPFWFLWLVLPLMTIPWTPFFFAAVWKYGRSTVAGMTVRMKGGGKTTVSRTRDLSIFALSWLLFPLLFFSLSGSKLPGYILPSLPPAAILTSLFLYSFAGESKRRDLSLKILAALMLLVIALLLQFVVPRYAENDTAKDLIGAASNSGFRTEKVANFLTVSHSAEFYAAGRLIRGDDGKQRRFRTADDLAEFSLKQENSRLLVLVPTKLSSRLTDSAVLKSRKLGGNTELEIFVIERR